MLGVRRSSVRLQFHRMQGQPALCASGKRHAGWHRRGLLQHHQGRRRESLPIVAIQAQSMCLSLKVLPQSNGIGLQCRGYAPQQSALDVHGGAGRAVTSAWVMSHC